MTYKICKSFLLNNAITSLPFLAGCSGCHWGGGDRCCRWGNV